ncbi:MAG: hypothetical protein CMJ18_22905 [Phycisphaeraceae bacterium]|nr:hypothetical protein [Phycisphaeraceae bacterium]
MSYSDYARAFMRQNPDVLMIGEVRDEATTQIALRAAQMGHVVLTTLHTRDAPSAIARLITLGAETSLIASAMLGILSQRLLRRVCTHCAEPDRPDPKVMARLPNIPKDAGFLRGRGCAHCLKSGYRGQVGVFELMHFDDDLRTKSLGGVDVKWADDVTFDRLYDDAIAKAARGVTSLEEVLRVVPLPREAS